MADERGVRDLPFIQDWAVAKATTFYAGYTLELDGLAWNLTYATITLQINTAAGVSALAHACPVDTAALGTWHLELSEEDTDLTKAVYYYAVKMILTDDDTNFTDGATFLLLKGKFVVGANVFET